MLNRRRPSSGWVLGCLGQAGGRPSEPFPIFHILAHTQQRGILRSQAQRAISGEKKQAQGVGSPVTSICTVPQSARRPTQKRGPFVQLPSGRARAEARNQMAKIFVGDIPHYTTEGAHVSTHSTHSHKGVGFRRASTHGRVPLSLSRPFCQITCGRRSESTVRSG